MDEREGPVMIVKPKQTVVLEAKEFCKGVRAVVKAAAKVSKENRSIEYINFSYKVGSSPVLAATDGYILGVYSFKHWAPYDDFDVLLDVKQLMSMVRELEKSAKVVPIDLKFLNVLENREVNFGTGLKVYKIDAASGHFPDFRKIIPSTFEGDFGVDRLELLNVLELAKIMTQDHQAPPNINKRTEYYIPTHTCKFEFLGDVLKISSEFVQKTCGLDTGGSYEGEVDIDPNPRSLKGFELFNAEKLVKAVSSFDTDRLRIYLNKSDKPSMIEAPEPNLVYLFLAFKPARMSLNAP